MKLNIDSLEEMREARGMSKSRFARLLDMEQTLYLRLLKTGGESVTVRTINRIGNALHMDPRDLLTKG